jgi:hypothetical protein
VGGAPGRGNARDYASWKGRGIFETAAVVVVGGLCTVVMGMVLRKISRRDALSADNENEKAY